MTKDPAVLFYTADFLSGTELFNMEQKGQYIYLLCVQHQNGHLPTEYMRKILGDGSPVWCKFKQDENGLWYQERMELEKKKRYHYCESRKRNKTIATSSHMSSHMSSSLDVHMGNENDNILYNKLQANKLTSIQKLDAFESLWIKYPKKFGKNHALRHFNASIETDNDITNITKALDNFLNSFVMNREKQFIPYGSTWFYNWKDWIDYKEEVKSEFADYFEPDMGKSKGFKSTR